MFEKNGVLLFLKTYPTWFRNSPLEPVAYGIPHGVDPNPWFDSAPPGRFGKRKNAFVFGVRFFKFWPFWRKKKHSNMFFCFVFFPLWFFKFHQWEMLNKNYSDVCVFSRCGFSSFTTLCKGWGELFCFFFFFLFLFHSFASFAWLLGHSNICLCPFVWHLLKGHAVAVQVSTWASAILSAAAFTKALPLNMKPTDSPHQTPFKMNPLLKLFSWMWRSVVQQVPAFEPNTFGDVLEIFAKIQLLPSSKIHIFLSFARAGPLGSSNNPPLGSFYCFNGSTVHREGESQGTSNKHGSADFESALDNTLYS